MANRAISGRKFLGVRNFVQPLSMLSGVLVLIVMSSVTGCEKSNAQAGQTLAEVNGQKITVLELNNELQHVKFQAGKQVGASRKLLESLIDRQLIVDAAELNKVDRSPNVILDIERAKSQIIAREYIRSITSGVAKPSKSEIDDYYQRHPELFSKRKEFVLSQLIIPKIDFSGELSSIIDSANTLDEVAGWMAKHGVLYIRRQEIRSSTDLPPDVLAKLEKLHIGQMFIVSEWDSQVLNAIVDFKDSPLSELNAAPLIEQLLENEKMKDAVKTKIAELRSRAKIEYMNASILAAVQAQSEASANGTVLPK